MFQNYLQKNRMYGIRFSKDSHCEIFAGFVRNHFRYCMNCYGIKSYISTSFNNMVLTNIEPSQISYFVEILQKSDWKFEVYTIVENNHLLSFDQKIEIEEN